ncbi:hypothetical protein [uncultured Shewanella sp.]|uniref:hypothetical protein n=1 Tax=uncultured Shewanella sp. TaxID=173975 RepID=UPI00260174BE|nr:hypothetical protein [uncultured Shewanella sp.]
MIKMVFILIFITACCLLYLTQKHQNWRRKSLAKKPWRILGFITLFISLCGFLSVYSTGAALFVWFVLLMVIFGILPFLTLIKPKGNQE